MMSVKSVKENVDKLEVSINTALEDLNKRLDVIENALSQRSPGVSLEEGKLNDILLSIENKGNEISQANKVLVGDLKSDILEIRNVVIENLLEENRKLRSKVALMDARLVENERTMYSMDQHSRKVNVEIEGIPQSVEQDKLKETVVDIFRNAGVDPVSVNDIEVVHRLNNKKRPQTTIMKAKRDFLETVFAKKKNLKNVGTKLGFGNDVAIYVNANLCPAYNRLAYNGRLLKKKKLIQDTWFSNGKVKIKLLDGNVKVISHEVDLVKQFHDFDEFSFNTTPFKISPNKNLDQEDVNSFKDLAGW